MLDPRRHRMLLAALQYQADQLRREAQEVADLRADLEREQAAAKQTDLPGAASPITRRTPESP